MFGQTPLLLGCSLMTPGIRFVPEEPLPPYAFVPGRFPHPESDPAGHSFGVVRAVPSFEPDNWPACRVYLRGVDLFNAGFFWECHVEFESLWIACERKGPFADHFKGLIQLAVAGVKHAQDMPAGERFHAKRAAQLWRGVVEAGQTILFGLSLVRLIEVAQEIQQHGWPAQTPLLLPRFPAEGL